LALFVVPVLNAAVFGSIAATAPDALQGRVTSAAQQLSASLGPLGRSPRGSCLDQIGPTRTVGVAVAVLGLLAVIGTTNRGLRHETDEDAQPQPG